MSRHAILSPSTSGRWLNCPGSKHANLLPDIEPNEAADKGTQLHRDAAGLITRLLKNTDNDFFMRQDDALSRYVDFVTGLSGEVHLEETCHSVEFHDKFFGTIDALVVNPEEIWIVDLKTGQRPVSANDNDQLQCYLNLARDRYPGIRRYFGVIVQDTVKIAEFTTAQLDRHYESVRAALSSDELHAGSWCTFCPLALTCRTRETWMYEEALVVLDEMEPSADDCKRVINLEPVVSAMAELAKKSLRTKLLRGEKITGWRLAAPLGNRQWIDEENVKSGLLAREFTELQFLEPAALKSPAQIKKLVGRSGEEFVESNVSRPKKPVIAVPESSTLPEYIRGDVFENLEG